MIESIETYVCASCGHHWEPVSFDPVGELVRPGAVDVCPECAAVAVCGEDLAWRPASADDVFGSLVYKQVMQLAELVLRRRTGAALKRLASAALLD